VRTATAACSRKEESGGRVRIEGEGAWETSMVEKQPQQWGGVVVEVVERAEATAGA